MLKRREREKSWILREKYGGREGGEWEQDLLRLKRGEPVDYIIGFVSFLGCHIDLRTKPLIPRPETEFWAEKLIKEIKREELGRKHFRCLDIFAGSGCVGIALLKHTKARVDFAEKNKDYCRQIKINADLNRIKKTAYRVFTADLFAGLPGGRSSGKVEKYDYIVANPPYIPTGRRLSRSVKDWEPAQALFGGKDGLFFIRKFLADASSFLKPAGKIYLEFGYGQKQKIEALVKKQEWGSINFQRDQSGRYRWLELQK